MPYRAPVAEFLFCLEHVVGFDRVAGDRAFRRGDARDVAAMLTEAGRICEEVLAPLNRAGRPASRAA
jgi:acyl-CoA dehydrogenase